MIVLLAADVIMLVAVKYFGVINPFIGAMMFLLNANIIPLFYIFFLYCYWNKVWDVIRLTVIGLAGHTAVSMYCGVVKVMADENVMIIVVTIFKFVSYAVFVLILSMTINMIVSKIKG